MSLIGSCAAALRMTSWFGLSAEIMLVEGKVGDNREELLEEMILSQVEDMIEKRQRKKKSGDCSLELLRLWYHMKYWLGDEFLVLSTLKYMYYVCIFIQRDVYR